MIKKISAVIFLSLSAWVFAGCDLEGCSGEPEPDVYKLINGSGQKIAIAVDDREGVFPDSLILCNSESYKWTAPYTYAPPFDVRKNKFDIYFNDHILIRGWDFPDERNISLESSYEPAGGILTFTFTEADYLYALEHGTPVGPA